MRTRTSGFGLGELGHGVWHDWVGYDMGMWDVKVDRILINMR